MRLKIIFISLALVAAGMLSGCAGSGSMNGPDARKTIIQPAPGGKAQESKDYAAIKDREKRTPYAGLVGDDYKRIIPLDELAGRIDATCKFITAYPDSPYKEEMALWKSEYLHDYIFGNFKYTASFEWMDGSNIFLKDYLNSYEDSKEKYKGSAFGSLLDEYVKLVNSEGNMMTDRVRDFVEKNSKYEQVVFQLPS